MARKRKADARTFGQDLMRGEHVVGNGKGRKLPGNSLGAIPGEMPSQYTGKGGDLPGPHGRKPLTWHGGKSEASQAVIAGNRKPPSTIPAGLAYGQIEMADGAERTITGTSIFDPVLCELAYRWFCPPDGTVLDPFAGGSVRGIVAAMLGRRYVGIDLRPEQIAANEAQARMICPPDRQPNWRLGDSRDMDEIAGDVEADMIFSCPPYGDLERYSDDPRDLSAMEAEDFDAAYAAIVGLAAARLKADRFACFVVGDYRDAAGFYRGFPARTVLAFEAAGLRLYNEAILVTAAGSLPVRARKQFEATRKLGKTHQNVLVFCKGDPRAATEAIGECEFGDPEAAIATSAGAELAATFGEVL